MQFIPSTKVALRADLRGGDTCAAAGLVATGSAPVLTLCRELIATGVDPDLPLHVYRADVLCLHVRSIGEAAGLDIDGHGRGFRPAGNGGTAPPIRFDAENGPPPPDDKTATPEGSPC